MGIQIRPGTPSDLPILNAMLFEAAYWRPGIERPALFEGLARADLVFLLSDWGRNGDAAVIAVLDGLPVGGAWYRLWTPEQHSYGYISPDIPELGIGVKKACRGQGIGTLLLGALLDAAQIQGLPGVSLSVEVENPARHLYRQYGFEIHEQVENSWTMVIYF